MPARIPSPVVFLVALSLALVMSCSFDSSLSDLSCDQEGDRSQGRVCQGGLWVELDDASLDTQPGPDGDDIGPDVPSPSDGGDGGDTDLCDDGLEMCGEDCVDTSEDEDHCGECDNRCITHGENSVVRCEQGACKRACAQGWADANEDWLDAEDPSNSDGCEHRCEPTNDGVEICDGIDNDCDGEIDEGLTTTYYLDEDGDDFGVDGESRDLCEPEDNYRATQAGDCDDTSASINPDATESCNGFDDDCDGDIDEGVQDTFYADNDGDGYGDPDVTTEACDPPSGYVVDNTDCDDSDAQTYPGASEACNGADNDCDGEVDEGVKDTFYADNDGDGFGDPSATTEACDPPSGYVADNTDCDDSDADINPDAAESCNGIDDDCDGDVDEGLDETFYADSDGDGYGDPNETIVDCSAPSGYVSNADDCDDSSAQIKPGATEVCDDQTDNNCDGATDCEDTATCGGQLCGDGNATCSGGVCQEDVCNDGIDNDGDQLVDCEDTDDCSVGTACDNDNGICFNAACCTPDDQATTCTDGNGDPLCGTQTNNCGQNVDCGGCNGDDCQDDSDCASGLTCKTNGANQRCQ